MSDLTGVELKLGRADTHLENLDDSVTPFRLDINAKPLGIEVDRETGRHVYSVQDLPPIPSDWALIAGEILFNLRSALDHLAWQLVILDKGQPGEQTQFPICKKPLYNKRNELVRVNIEPAISNPEVLEALHECQPYSRPHGVLPKDKITIDDRHPLHQLRLLNNIDKHRLLLVVVYAIDTFRPMYWDYRGRSLKPRFNLQPLNEGSPVVSFDFGGADPPADFDPKIAFEVAINTAELPHLVNVPLTRALHRIAQSVNMDVLNRHFRRLFA